MADKVRMIVTDLDGTLLRNDKSISDKTKNVISALKERGIVFGIATARPIRSVKNFLPFLEYDFAIYHNGAVVTNEDKLLKNYGIENPLGIIREIQDRLDSCNICVEAEDVMYSSFDTKEIWPGFEFVATRDFRELEGKIADKVIVEAHSKDDLEKIRAVLPDDLYAELSENQVAMILNKKATKLEGIKVIADLYDVKLCNIATFGDDYNDIDMLRECGFGVAVDNALLEVKEAARYICASNEADGEVNWIEENVLC